MTKEHRHVAAPRVQVLDAILVIVGTIVAILGIVVLVRLVETRRDTANVRDRYEECVVAAHDLMDASDDLTMYARMYVVTGDLTKLNAYIDEYQTVRRRDHAVETLQNSINATRAQKDLQKALDLSNQLAQRELYAMRLEAEAVSMDEMPELLAAVKVSLEDEALNAEQKHDRAQNMLLGYAYDHTKALIQKHVDHCFTDLSDYLRDIRNQSYNKERHLHALLMVVFVLEVALLAIAGIINYILIMRPLQSQNLSIQKNEPLEVRGSREVRNVVDSYNHLYYENLRRTNLLQQQAQTDSLTGLLNRGSFDSVLDNRTEDIALLIIDVDLFKVINDTYGHEIGDAVLKKVSESLKACFRTTDYVCRIGGDEFAVVLTQIKGSMRDTIARKIKTIGAGLVDGNDGLPDVTLSIGIAFSAGLPLGVNVFHAADEALYKAKRLGRNQFVFYEAE
ncbi:MAG: diguanylate cyclase [Coriobacteriales bacterium]|nr:diguanylate cyclase [Coriobacteriales bacterium]